ncbi:DUF4440 domain-containing protein [uncultured Umboniibacter sp.]|uniref:YybH family protein n=1 Tax=uncultured Umboniibacter sp. TaxID=1798917 RepID=UPI00260F3050|nr:DUF4440 domain-containing protein [uncultured Umboniibacter sp.]
MRSRLLLTVRTLIFGAIIIVFNSAAEESSSVLDEHPSITVLKSQQEAWNRGDLNGFMNGYWQSDELSLVGPEIITRGWNEALARYEIRYPNVEIMGTLRFDVIDIQPLQTDYLWMIGRWQLNRANERSSGHFTLLWQLIDGEWLIVSDHSS